MNKTSPRSQLRVFRNYPALCRSAAQQLVRAAVKAIEARGAFHLALAGGSTPQGVYAALRSSQHSRQVDWTKVHIFWGDERWVPSGHLLNNSRLAFQEWLSQGTIPAKNIHRMPTQAPTPSKGALQYEEKLKAHFKCSRLERPVFDLILLGLGEDGHVASLFPGHAVLTEKKRWVRAVTVKNPHPRRLTLTVPVIQNARAVWVLVSGKKKMKILEQVLLKKAGFKRLPVQLIDSGTGKVSFLADREAAGKLKSGKFFPGSPSAK